VLSLVLGSTILTGLDRAPVLYAWVTLAESQGPLLITMDTWKVYSVAVFKQTILERSIRFPSFSKCSSGFVFAPRPLYPKYFLPCVSTHSIHNLNQKRTTC